MLNWFWDLPWWAMIGTVVWAVGTPVLLFRVMMDGNKWSYCYHCGGKGKVYNQ